MIVVGVTGGVGTGKSTVAGLFKRLGAVVVDADRITHGLMRPGEAVHQRIRAAFGDSILTRRGAIDRKRLGERVFGRREQLARLTRIIHPEVRRQIHFKLGEVQRRRPRSIVVLDVPLLVEAGGAYRCDFLVVVTAPLKEAVRRLRRQRAWTHEEVARRARLQLPLRRKAAEADFVVRNGGSLASTRRQVIRIWRQLKENVP